MSSVMLVGHGFMGANHRRKIEFLESQGKARLAGIVDIDPAKKPDCEIPFYTSFEEGFSAVKPSIISICSSTKTHFFILQQLVQLADQLKIYPHILVEKPLVASSEQAEQIGKLLQGYPSKVSSGYLFRQSPTIASGVAHLRSQNLTVEKITTVWQKDRVLKGPVRPSEGVHIDESTHPIDLILNCLLPQLGIDTKQITIRDSSFKRQSEVGLIVDQEMQNALYQDEPEKLDPVAEVSYTLDVSGITICGFSSFKRGPQRREIEIETSNQTSLLFEFDVAGSDILSLVDHEKKEALIKPSLDKLQNEWEAFLDYCETGQESYRIQTFSEMELDIRLTEALGTPLQHPHVLTKSTPI